MHNYFHAHQSRLNLALHMFAVPQFVVAHAILLWGVLTLSLGLLSLAVALVISSLGVQGWGHRHEVHQPEPFKGVWDFAKRLYTEQFHLYPRMLLIKLRQRIAS